MESQRLNPRKMFIDGYPYGLEQYQGLIASQRDRDSNLGLAGL